VDRWKLTVTVLGKAEAIALARDIFQRLLADHVDNL
jgi:hypothetical protein